NTWKEQEKQLYMVAFAPDGETIASASKDGIRSWVIRTGRLSYRLEGPAKDNPLIESTHFESNRNDKIANGTTTWDDCALGCSPDSKTLIMTTPLGFVLSWNMATERKLAGMNNRQELLTRRTCKIVGLEQWLQIARA